MKKVVLAYSGGLDTTYCALYLSEKMGLKVYTALANTGGFSAEELKEIEERTKLLQVKKHLTIDVTSTYYKKCIRYMIMGNMLKNNTYPLSVSSERAFQAIAIAEYANAIDADYIAHGSTGAGNDQIRFDLIFKILAPNAQIITPTRDLELSREDEIAYLKEKGIKANFEKMKYSINAGIWGTSVGGLETLTSHKALPEEAYPSPLKKTGEEQLELEFEKGELIGVNGTKYSPLDAIKKVNKLGSAYAIGRDIHVGDTIIGTKGRVGFEAAGPLLIIKAHEALEKHTLTKWQLYWKKQLSEWYGMFLHEAQYLEPVMRNIEKFLEDSQQNVSGKVFLKLAPKRYEIEGIESKHDLMDAQFGAYGEKAEGWTAEDVKGFINILGNPLKIYHTINKEETKKGQK